MSLGAVARMIALGGLLAALSACERDNDDPRLRIAGSDPDRGRSLIQAHGCVACHEVPGFNERSGRVGPPLRGLRDRGYIAGRITNRPGRLAQWIMDAPRLDPQTVMPSFPTMSDEDARDIAAYLYEAG